MKNRLSSNLLFGLAAAAILAMPALAQESAAAESKGPEVKFSGEVEFDAYTGDVLNDDKQSHSYASTFDFNVESSLMKSGLHRCSSKPMARRLTPLPFTMEHLSSIRMAKMLR